MEALGVVAAVLAVVVPQEDGDAWDLADPCC